MVSAEQKNRRTAAAGAPSVTSTAADPADPAAPDGAAAAADARGAGQADTEPADRQIRDALLVAGIGRPALAELAALPGITATLIRREAERAAERGKGPGALIENIRTAVAAKAAKQRRAAQARQQQRDARLEPELTGDARAASAILAFARSRSRDPFDLARQQGWDRERWDAALIEIDRQEGRVAEEAAT